jgi:ankyrin repeat protein
LLDDAAAVDAPGVQGMTPLVLAIRGANLDVFRLLLEHGAEPDGNEADRRRVPLLVCAGREHELDFARALLDAGADLTRTDSDGVAPMARAVTWKRVELARILAEAGAPVELPAACMLGDVERVSELLAEQPDFDPLASIVGWERTPLEAAVETGDLELVRMLLDAVPSFDPDGKFGAMLLHVAARCADTRLLRWTLARVCVDSRRQLDGTALHEAAEANRPEAIGVLLDAGARLEAQSYSYGTALHAAAAWGAVDALEVLLQRGARLDARNMSGQTLLGRAASHAQLATARWLVEVGADVNARNWSGLTPLGEVLLPHRHQADPFAGMQGDTREFVGLIENLRAHGGVE